MANTGRANRNKINEVATKVVCSLIEFYRFGSAGVVGMRCRFYPSCSAYARYAFSKFGMSAVILVGWRVLRCNPFCRGGVELVKERFWDNLINKESKRWKDKQG